MLKIDIKVAVLITKYWNKRVSFEKKSNSQDVKTLLGRCFLWPNFPYMYTHIKTKPLIRGCYLRKSNSGLVDVLPESPPGALTLTTDGDVPLEIETVV